MKLLLCYNFGVNTKLQERNSMNYDTIKLLNLEQFNVHYQNLETIKIKNTLYCHLTLKQSETACPTCASISHYIHDYRTKKLKHSISTNNPCFIVYKARRYKCKDCGCVFYEPNPFSLKNDKSSNYTILAVLNSLRSHTVTFTEVAGHFNLTKTSVIRIFDQYVICNRKALPGIICFDEVYTSRKSYQKYAFVMVDFFTSEVIEVFSSRHKYRLSQSFSMIKAEERQKVDYIIIDMWETYLDLAETYFYHAKVAIDSFHVIQQLNNAMIAVRLKIMRKYDKRTKSVASNDMYYYMLKKFHYFFIKDYNRIYDGPIKIFKIQAKWLKSEIRKYLLSIDDDLREAYFLKEKYREFNLTADFENCDVEFETIIYEFVNSKLEEFRAFGRLLKRWKPYIKNSFIRINGKRLSNGPIEGVVSRIKTIMKNANGYVNFGRLRNRIMYSLNNNMPIQGMPRKKV